MSIQNKLFFTVCLLQTVSCIQSSESDIRPKAADPMLHEKQHPQIDLERLYQLCIAHVPGERFSGDDAATPTYHQSRLRNIDKRIMGLAENIDDLHNQATPTGKDFAHLSMQNQESKLMNLWEQLELAQQSSRILRKQQVLARLVAKFAKTQPIPAAPTYVKHKSSASDIRPKAADPMLHEKQRHPQIDLERLYQLSIAHVPGERSRRDDTKIPSDHQSRLRNNDKGIMGLAENIDDLHNQATPTGKDFAHLSMQNQESKLMNLWEQLELAQQSSRIFRKQQMLATLVAKFAKTQPIPAAPTYVKHQSSACFPKAQDRPIAQAQANVETTKAIQPSISTEQPSTHVRQPFIRNFTEGELNLFTPRSEYCPKLTLTQ